MIISKKIIFNQKELEGGGCYHPQKLIKNLYNDAFVKNSNGLEVNYEQKT